MASDPMVSINLGNEVDLSKQHDGTPHVFVLHRPSLAGRCSAVTGDFFDAVPEGGDVYILCAVVHDWDDGDAAAVLRRVAQAMSGEARLLIVDNVIPEGSEAHAGKWIDLEMLLMTGGRERTAAEFAALTAAAGLRIERIVPTAVSVSVIEARRFRDGAAEGTARP